MANRLFVPRFAPMPRLSADPIVMTVPHEQVLTRLVRAHATPQKLAERARMILPAAAGTGVRETARQLEVWPKTVRHWLSALAYRGRGRPGRRRLTDAPCPGAPATFTPQPSAAFL
jgi:putative transposase